MLALVFSFALIAATVLILHGGLTSARGVTIAGMDPQSLGMGGLAVLAAGYFFGPLYGVTLILSVMLHEFGHVAAYRICGHADARFRLIPLMGGMAISNQHPASQEKAFFIAIMGPGICLAPMVAAYAAEEVVWESAPLAAEFLWTFARVTAALNFFNLLPFWPLDGGRCVRLITSSLWPRATRIVSLAMSGAMVAAAVWMQSLLLLMFAMIGVQSLFQTEALTAVQRRMPTPRAFLALSIYVFTTAAHLVGGAWLVARYF